jgi:hypothetical protein
VCCFRIFVDDDLQVAAAVAADAGQEDAWVVFKVFKKKHHQKELSGGSRWRHGGVVNHGIRHSSSDDTLDHILQYMGKS